MFNFNNEFLPILFMISYLLVWMFFFTRNMFFTAIHSFSTCFLHYTFTAVNYWYLKRRFIYHLLTFKFCGSRPLLLFVEKIQILSVSLKVLLEHTFTAFNYWKLKRKCRFHLLAFKFCWSRPLLLFEEKTQILSVSFYLQ